MDRIHTVARSRDENYSCDEENFRESTIDWSVHHWRTLVRYQKSKMGHKSLKLISMMDRLEIKAISCLREVSFPHTKVIDFAEIIFTIVYFFQYVLQIWLATLSHVTFTCWWFILPFDNESQPSDPCRGRAHDSSIVSSFDSSWTFSSPSMLGIVSTIYWHRIALWRTWRVYLPVTQHVLYWSDTTDWLRISIIPRTRSRPHPAWIIHCRSSIHCMVFFWATPLLSMLFLVNMPIIAATSHLPKPSSPFPLPRRRVPALDSTIAFQPVAIMRATLQHYISRVSLLITCVLTRSGNVLCGNRFARCYFLSGKKQFYLS